MDNQGEAECENSLSAEGEKWRKMKGNRWREMKEEDEEDGRNDGGEAAVSLTESTSRTNRFHPAASSHLDKEG